MQDAFEPIAFSRAMCHLPESAVSWYLHYALTSLAHQKRKRLYSAGGADPHVPKVLLKR